MFRRILLIFTDAELRIKLLKIVGLLIIARLLSHIPIPVLGIKDISPVIENDQVFGLLNTISGGAYGTLSFVMLGVGPYITASIVIQLLGVIVPKIKEIQKEEGEMGQQKINRWTRFLTVPLSALSGWGIIQFLSSGAVAQGQVQLPEVLTRNQITPETFWNWFAVIASMTAGSIIIMWIGEIITEFKMGNGISLMILGGIVVRLPKQLGSFWNYATPAFNDLVSKFNFSKLGNWDVWKALIWENSSWEPVRLTLLFLSIFAVTLFLVIFVNDAVRKITVIYSRRGHSEGKSRTMANVKADLPIKVNMAGVLPIIFAISFILFPTIISRFFSTANIQSVRDGAKNVENYLSTNLNETEIKPTNLPNNFLNFYGSSNISDIKSLNTYDGTIGKELFGFRISNLQKDKNFSLPANPTANDLDIQAKNDLKNVYFEGTFMRFESDSTNLSFLPQYSFVFQGVLAYTFYYFILIVFFTYFYTSTVAFKTDDVAENLQRSGVYIPGYRPGEETMNYLSYVSNRLNVVGSVFLAVIALVPLLFQQNLQFGDGTLTGIVGGTTLLILVSVTIETLKQIEAQATAVDYERFTKY